MKKYLVLYKAPIDARKQMGEMTAEQQAEGMKAWMDWAKNCGDKLIDLGQPLANGVRVNPNGIAAANSDVAGYSVIQANDIEEAEGLMKRHPHLAWNAACSIELHEMQPLPGM